MNTIEKINLDKLVTGSEPKSGAMIFKTGAPLDDRTAVRCKAALISQTALGEVDPDTKQSTDKKGWIFNGLITADCQTGDIYVLYDRASLELLSDEAILALTDAQIDEKVAKAWKKLASSSDVSSLSGVFTFKGVAEAINPDQSIITTRGVITTEIKNKQQQVITPSEILYCVTSAYEFDMDVYYGWGTSLNDIRFWTDTPTVNSDTTQYDKGAGTSITAYEFNGILYYPTETDNKYESIGGQVVYIKGRKVYETEDFTETSIGDATEVTYTGYAFTEKTPKIILNKNTTSETITASPDNSGHVYQIGENEYASNGQIWVKLGSPVEDWIII